jgi:hypothetical protein
MTGALEELAVLVHLVLVLAAVVGLAVMAAGLLVALAGVISLVVHLAAPQERTIKETFSLTLHNLLVPLEMVRKTQQPPETEEKAPTEEEIRRDFPWLRLLKKEEPTIRRVRNLGMMERPNRPSSAPPRGTRTTKRRN